MKLRFLAAITAAIVLGLCMPVAVVAQTAAAPSASDLTPEAHAALRQCIIYYNQGKTEASLSACDRAIALDPLNPKMADAYFVKGSLLAASSTADSSGKLHAPAGTVETLKKYLELAPTGTHRGDAQQMLDLIQGTPASPHPSLSR
jgi:tetratricopeptide (TPR) repeat protein